jgi:hypothetical protein
MGRALTAPLAFNALRDNDVFILLDDPPIMFKEEAIEEPIDR